MSVMKSIDRIEKIRTTSDKRLSIDIYSWQISRIMRRDFNLLTAKMFHACRSAQKNDLVHDVILRIHAAADNLNYDFVSPSLSLEKYVSWQFDVRVVTDNSQLLLDSFLLVDPALLSLNNSDLDMESRNNHARHFFDAYSQLKKQIFDFKKNQ